MRALLSAVGTRGDVQPIFAVAVRLRELGHDVRLAIPPNFVARANELGFEAASVGIEMRAPPKGAPPPTAEELAKLRASMPDLISNQFDVVEKAVEGCDAILGGNAHQYAARSIAELRQIPCAIALYAPVAIPSSDLPPPPNPGEPWTIADASTHEQQWKANAASWNTRALERVNFNRTKRGLAPIDDVLAWNITDTPWLACDPALAPIPSSKLPVFETGAWILEDTTPLSKELEAFLRAGDAPIYLGFGSMPAPEGAARILVEAARAVGRRAIVSKGWASLDVADAHDCIAIDDVNQQALFKRVACVVHHGGAGTTHTAARAGVPQVIAPMFSDQFYWAHRVRALGVGSSVAGKLSTETLTSALRDALNANAADRARALATELTNDGALVAAKKLVALVH